LSGRRRFLSNSFFWAGLLGSAGEARGVANTADSRMPAGLGQLYLEREGRRRRTSSRNPTGKNADRVNIEPGASYTMADIRGAGCIRHIWLTTRNNEPDCLRRLVLRAWWDGEDRPSIESPLGDFFGVGHARTSNYWSLPLNMVTGGAVQASARAAMNCFFPMPFSSAARVAVASESKEATGLYFYVDYEEYGSLPPAALRFHAQWRRQNPTPPTVEIRDRNITMAQVGEIVNLDGANNYVILEARGRGHYVGCNLSIDHINPVPNFSWFGEGDDMIFIDGETVPSLHGTGTEDYFCAAFGYPSGQVSMPYHGISLAGPTEGPEAYSGKWTMYRFHVEDPIQFQKSIRVTIEHGHANVHADDYSSVAYWYQAEPHQAFPPLAPVEQRLPLSDVESLRRFWRTR
jgi:hypothetical protein